MTDQEVVRIAHSVLQNFIKVPNDLERFIPSLGIKIKPLSLYLENGFSAHEIFDIIGNQDGAAMKSGGYYIIYNDLKPRRRIRFTLSEELMHIVLGHADDMRFQLGKPYDTALYRQYEHEAKLGASILLMPPSIYYRYKNVCSLKKLSAQLDISEAAAFRAIKYYDEHEWVREYKYQPLCDMNVSYKIRPVMVMK